MSIINTALIGKLKKTKADKSNVLQLDGDVAYTPVGWYNPATKLYVDTAISNIPVTIDTNTYVINGNVQGNTLSLNQSDGSAVHIDVGSLLDDTTNTVSSGVLSGNQITFTRQDGTTFAVDVTSLYDDTNLVTAVNGQTGSVSVPLLSGTSFNTTTNVLTISRSDSTSYTADLSSLAGETFDQLLNTTNDVNFNSVVAPYGDFPNLNVNNAISFGTVSGSTNQVVITRADGTSWWSDVKTINGQSLIGSGNIVITASGVDKYVTSGTVSGSTLTLTNNDATTIDINVGALLDDTTNTVSTGVLSGNVITFTRQDNSTFQVDVSALYDDTNLVTSVNGQTGAITITDTNDYVDGVSLSGNVLTLTRTGALADLTVDLSSLRTTDTDNYVDSAALNGNVLTLGRSGSLPDLTVDLSTLHSVDTDNYIDSASLSGNNLVLGRTGSLPDLTVDLSSLGGGSNNVLVQRQRQDFTAITGQTQFTTTFTLTDVEVFYNGLKLDNEDYTVSGYTLTLLEATEAGDNIEVIDYGNAIAVDASYQKYTFDVTTETSVFNVAYAIGQVEVFLNGMKLTDTEYTADNGTSITLVPPVQAGDYVEIISMIATTSGNYYTKTEVDQMIAGAGTGSSTTSGLTSQVVNSFSTIDYRGGEYLLMVTGNSGFMSLKMLVLFNGTTALNSQYGQLGADLGTFDTLVVGDIVQVLFTPVDSSSVVQFSRTLIENLSANPTPSLPTDLNSGSGTLDLNSGSGTIDLNGTSVQGDLNSGSGTLDMNSGTGTSDLNQ